MEISTFFRVLDVKSDSNEVDIRRIDAGGGHRIVSACGSKIPSDL